MNTMNNVDYDLNGTVRRVAVSFTAALFIASVVAAIYTGESATEVWREWLTILTSPSPLVTDYFRLGSLSASLWNAAVCGLVCTIMIHLPGAVYRPTVWAGYFLVIAHCFYGLNLINMWPPILGFLLFCHLRKKRMRYNLDQAMFITSFGPFFSEILFRYPMPYDVQIPFLPWKINPIPLEMVALAAVFLGCTLPSMLSGASKLHRGFNLYNGGLATGLLGLFLYSFMYKTMGVTPEGPMQVTNEAYTAHGESYLVFGTIFYVIVSLLCIAYGWKKNGKSFRGYRVLLQDSGYKANFIRDYGAGLTWINLGFYCLMMVAYFDIVILCTDGAGFTGPTFGIILAAMTFACMGQTPANVWPILLGYALLSALVHAECLIANREIPWTLSTQGYMNGLAFATGLCPFAGKYGWKIGVVAGFISAVMCTTTSVMHGGFVLYNGGLTAGISALILLPLLDTFMRDNMKDKIKFD